MIAIETKYLGATDTKGSRIKAFTCNGHSVTIPYPHEFSGAECHAQAAIALCKKQEWDKEHGYSLISGGSKDGYVFVFGQSEKFDIV